MFATPRTQQLAWRYFAGLRGRLTPGNASALVRMKGLKTMNRRHLLSVAAIAGTLFAATGCVATGSDGYYGDGGYGYGYNRPGDTVYVRDGYYDDRSYRERDRDRQRAEREREREREARERERDRQARDRDRDQRARDEDRRRELDRQARERDRDRQQRERDNNRSRFGSSQQQADCARYRDQVRSGSDTINVPSHPC